MTQIVCTGVCFGNVVQFINGESTEVSVNETERAIAAQVLDSERYNRLLDAMGQSHARGKATARWKLEDELRKAELLLASLDGQMDSFESEWEAMWRHKHTGMIKSVMKKMVEKGELPPEDI
jgi:hypothetical protein